MCLGSVGCDVTATNKRFSDEKNSVYYLLTEVDISEYPAYTAEHKRPCLRYYLAQDDGKIKQAVEKLLQKTV